MSDPNRPFDVAVIGAGVVGTAVARLVSRHDASVVLIESGAEVGAGVSKANTAILHTGFDATPGSIEARLVARGYGLLREWAPLAGVSIDETGALLVAWSEEQLAALPALAAKAAANGYLRTEIVDATTARELEPHLGPGALGGLLVPDEHIIDPWSVPLGFALDAIANGATVLRDTEVVDVVVGVDTTELVVRSRAGDPGSPVRARFVVNAAGLHGDTVHRRFGFGGFTIRPRRGELIVFDKLARPLLNRTILPVPTATTKGVLVAPTVFGNVMLGPTADDVDDFSTASTREGIDRLLAQGRRILPALLAEEVTAVYAGLRPATEHPDYQLRADAGARYVALGGIRSTGLSASMAIAEAAVELLAECGATLRPLVAPASASVPRLGWADRPPHRPEQGRIVCHCEQVTEGALRAACAGPLPATTVDGVRRRTRALNGRCQGFYCSAEVAAVTGLTP